MEIVYLIINMLIVIYFYKKSKAFSLMFTLVFFMQFWQFVSCLYIENGIYIVEEKLYSYRTGASFRLFILQVIFYFSIILTYKFLRKNNKFKIKENEINNKEKFILMILYIIIIMLLFNVLISGNAILNSNITRFNFWSTYSQLGFLFPLQVIQYELQLINGVIFINSRNKICRVFSLLLWGITIIYYLLIGNLFTQLLYISFFFLLPFFIKRVNEKNILLTFKQIIIIPIIFIIMVSFKLNYFIENPQTYSGITNSPLQSLTYRALGLQGHTWWGIDRLIQENSLYNYNQINTEINAIKNPEEFQKEAGIWYLMNQIAPSEVYNAYISGNGTFNSGYPAINIALFGYFGAGVLQIINGILFTLICFFVYKAIIKKEYFKIFIGSIVYYFYYEYFFMGNIGQFGNLVPKLGVFLLIIIIISSRLGRKFKIVIKK